MKPLPEVERGQSSPDIWREERLVEPFDVDIIGRLRPETLLTYLLNSAWGHAQGTYYGNEQLSARNLMWVLIKVEMRITRLPRWGEKITIETWGKRAVRLYALRDFTVTSGNEKLVSATSSWMVLDRTSGRPRRFDVTQDNFPWQPVKDEIETNLEKVGELKAGKERAKFSVLFSDIDMNRHVNSARYLQWMMDSHSYDHLVSMEPRSIELSFLSEALPEEEVTVFSEEQDGRELCAVRRTADGRDLCRARLQWIRSP